MSKTITGPQRNRIQPKLRMFANGDTAVNVLRSELSSCLAVSDRLATSEPVTRGSDAVPIEKDLIPHSLGPKTLTAPPSDVLVDVFVEVTDEKAVKKIRNVRSRCGNLVSACMTLKEAEELANDDRVARIELGDSLKVPDPVEGLTARTAPPLSGRRVGSESLHRHGRNVLIGIIDVGGFDFAHPDFRRNGATRFERIWDQGGNTRPAPYGGKEKQFAYGAEFTQAHLNRAIRVANRIGLPAWEIERQSQLTPSSHGTHVASIAAGNRGVARKAKLAGVLISLPKDDLDRRKSFYDSTRIADAVDYLFRVGNELGCDAVSINISLGTNGHAHDASSAVSRWIDSALSSPGRSICVAAGNAGQEAPTSLGDTGFVMGRIHTSGRIPAAGLDEDVEWVVVGNTVADLSENELEIWYSPQDRFAVSLRPPGSTEWIGPIEPGDFIQNRQLADKTFVSIYNEVYHPANGDNYLGIYLSPFLTRAGVVGVRGGTWTVRLHGREVRSGHYHGWIERDDPRPIGRAGDLQLWRFPSFFSQRSNVDRSSVSSLACGRRTVSVANLDTRAERINASSSQGPTRDGRAKPEVAAPGTDIAAANGFAEADRPWVAKTGTSMASPYVTGVTALMLASDPTLTAAQLGGIIQRTAHPLPGSDFEWRDDAGYGEIDAEACVREAHAVNRKEDRT